MSSVGRNLPASGPHRQRFVCLRGGRHRSRPGERNPEQARTSTALRVMGKALTGRRGPGERCVEISLGGEGAA